MLKKKNESSQNRIEYLDTLRIMATIAVIMIHVAASQWYFADINSFDWFVIVIYDGIVRWAVPIFVMISGVLFLEKENEGIDQLYRKYIFKIAIVFIIWSLIYLFDSVLRENLGVKECIVKFFTGEFHMWYLYMITGLYMLVPLLKEIVRNMTLTKYFLFLTLVFTFVLPYIADLFLLIDSSINMIIESGIETINFHFTLGYVGYFVLGYYLNRINTDGKIKWLIYFLGAIGFIFTVLLTLQMSWVKKIPDETFYDNFTLNVLFESIAIFVLIKNNFQKLKRNFFKKEIIKRISKYTFGVYLSHVLVIDYVISAIEQKDFNCCSLIYIPMITLLVAIISFGISMLLNQIPILKRFMV